MANVKVSKQKSLGTFAVRIDQDRIALAQACDINIADLFRRVLNEELAKHSGVCPTCGTDIRKSKKTEKK